MATCLGAFVLRAFPNLDLMSCLKKTFHVMCRFVKVSQKTVAVASLVVSLGSIVFGVVSKAMQQVTLTMIDGDGPLLGDDQQDFGGSGLTESMGDIVARLRQEGFRLTKSDRDGSAEGGRQLSGAE